MPKTYTKHNIISICPAPAGSRVAYADKTAFGGIFYHPLYFMAAVRCEEWTTRPTMEAPPSEMEGESYEVVLPVTQGDFPSFFTVDDADNLLAVLMPGEGVDPTDHKVIAARAAFVSDLPPVPTPCRE